MPWGGQQPSNTSFSVVWKFANGLCEGMTAYNYSINSSKWQCVRKLSIWKFNWKGVCAASVQRSHFIPMREWYRHVYPLPAICWKIYHTILYKCLEELLCNKSKAQTNSCHLATAVSEEHREATLSLCVQMDAQNVSSTP